MEVEYSFRMNPANPRFWRVTATVSECDPGERLALPSIITMGMARAATVTPREGTTAATARRATMVPFML